VTPTRRSLVIFAVLVGVCVMLGWSIFGAMNRPPPSLESVTLRTSPQPTGVDEAPLPSFEARPVEQFISVLDRPLFRADRRPVVAEVEENPVVEPEREQPLEATLHGVLLAEGQRVALLKPNRSSATFMVSQGEIFLGWRLLEVQPDKAIFGRDDERVTLTLVYKSDSATAPKRAR